MTELFDTTAPLPAETRDAVFVIVPAFNEGPKIVEVLSELKKDFPNVVVVDDGSSDDTFSRAKSAALHVLRHVINRGQGAALQTGITYALSQGARYIVTFDADGQHDPADIARLVAPLSAEQCDVTLVPDSSAPPTTCPAPAA